MAQTINFTSEHRKELMDLAGEALVNGTTFKGSINTDYNIHDLFHNCTVGTLSSLHAKTKKEVLEIENLDEWSLTEYQQKKAARLKKQLRIYNLLIGFKRKQEQDAANRAELKNLQVQLETLKQSTMKPEDQIKALEAKIAGMAPIEEATAAE